MLGDLNIDALFSAGMIICAIMIPIWLLRVKSKGTRAYFMASAFAVMGLLFHLLKITAPMPILIIAAILLVGLLAADALMRIKEQEANRTS